MPFLGAVPLAWYYKWLQAMQKKTKSYFLKKIHLVLLVTQVECIYDEEKLPHFCH